MKPAVCCIGVDLRECVCWHGQLNLKLPIESSLFATFPECLASEISIGTVVRCLFDPHVGFIGVEANELLKSRRVLR
jgi:hypothetical protein